MNFNELIQKRYSVRAYKSDCVEEEKLQQVLEAARLAPTAANRQPFQFIVIHTKGKEAELKRIYEPDWFTQPPLVICVCATPAQAWSRIDKKNYSRGRCDHRHGPPDPRGGRSGSGNLLDRGLQSDCRTRSLGPAGQCGADRLYAPRISGG